MADAMRCHGLSTIDLTEAVPDYIRLLLFNPEPILTIRHQLPDIFTGTNIYSVVFEFEAFGNSGFKNLNWYLTLNNLPLLRV